MRGGETCMVGQNVAQPAVVYAPTMAEVWRRRHGITFGTALCVAFLVSACAARQAPSTVVPEPQPSVSRTLWLNPPVAWTKVEPAIRVFVAQNWLGRLVCPNDEQPHWRLTKIRDPFEDYAVECPEHGVVEIALNLTRPPPNAPLRLRLLTIEGFERYRAAMKASEDNDVEAALAHLDAALELEPEEPVYLAARASVLNAIGR